MWRRAILACLWVLLCATTALAQPSDEDKATARALMDQGDAFMKSGNFDRAVEAYRAADDLMKVPTTGLALGQGLAAKGLLVEASSVLLRVAHTHPTEKEPEVFIRARADADALAADVNKRIPSLTFAVTGLAASVAPSVTVDGSAVPPDTLRFPRRVNPGARRVQATAPGYAPLSADVTVAESQVVEVPLAFVAARTVAPAPKPPPITSTPDAPDEAGPSVSALTITALAVGGAALIAGAITGGMSLAKGADLEQRCAGDRSPGAGCEPRQQDAIDSALVIAHVSTITLVAGGVFVALGGVLLAIDLTADDAATAIVGPGFTGIHGQF